jgi:hypothetical protein
MVAAGLIGGRFAESAERRALEDVAAPLASTS